MIWFSVVLTHIQKMQMYFDSQKKPYMFFRLIWNHPVNANSESQDGFIVACSLEKHRRDDGGWFLGVSVKFSKQKAKVLESNMETSMFFESICLLITFFI